MTEETLFRVIVPMFHMQIIESDNPDDLLKSIRAYVSGAFRHEIRSGELVIGWDNIKCERVTKEQLMQEYEEYERGDIDTPDLQQEYNDDGELYPSSDSLE